DMLSDWRSALATSTSSTADDAEDVAERANPDTPLTLSGLTPRALSALEPFRLETVGDLARLDTSRLSRFNGNVAATKRAIRGRAKQWRLKFASQLAAGPSAPGGSDSADPFAAPEVAAHMLLEAAGSSEQPPALRAAAAVLLGFEGDVDPFAVRAEFTAALGMDAQAQAASALAGIRDAWAQAPEAAKLLDRVFDRVLGVVDDLDGA